MRSRLNWEQKGRILYGNETDVNEYPWQVLKINQRPIWRFWKSIKDRSETKYVQGVNVDWPKPLLRRNSDQRWVDCHRRPLCWPAIQVGFSLLFHISFLLYRFNMYYLLVCCTIFICVVFDCCIKFTWDFFVLLRRHFDRITVSLGDHNVQVYDDTKNVFRWGTSFFYRILKTILGGGKLLLFDQILETIFLTGHLNLSFLTGYLKPFCRKLKRIVRSPQYDNNFINGDMALLQLEKKVCSAELCLEKDILVWSF